MFSIWISVLMPASLWALETSVVSTDITIVLAPDLEATITQRVEWKASGGGMHGFYFEGEPFLPAFDPELSYADIPGGKRLRLDIKPMGGRKYDVVLANGASFSGTAFYTLSYRASFAKAGLVGRTKSAKGEELVYFDYAPVTWDSPLESRTLRLVLPKNVGGATLSNAEKSAIPMLTEVYVNEQNRIDWYGSPGTNSSWWLTGLFYQKNISTQASQRLQLYFPAGYLDIMPEALDSAGTGAAPSSGDDSAGRSDSGGEAVFVYPRDRILPYSIAGASLAGIGVFLYTRRLKSFRKKRELAKSIS
jgi:hypothetical protein